jgi:hypothetical protein
MVWNGVGAEIGDGTGPWRDWNKYRFRCEFEALAEHGEFREKIIRCRQHRTARTPNDPKLRDSRVRRGTSMVSGKATIEAGALTHGALRYSA